MSLFRLVSAAIPDGGVAKLEKFQCFFLTLINLCGNYDQGFRFEICESTVSCVFLRWIEAMDVRMSFLIIWPDRECLQKTMPFCFRPNYGLKVTGIIDCFEIFIEKPSDLFALVSV